MQQIGSTMPSRDESWPIRHRPYALVDTALSPGDAKRLKAFIDTGAPHHLLIAGPSGVGKTTVTEIVIRSVFGEKYDRYLLRVSATETRSVEFIRERVIPFIRSRGGLFRHIEADFRSVVVISEADGLTSEAQQSLKDLLETYASTCTVIFTTNHLDKIDLAIRSRCEVVELGPPPLDERARVLAQVLEREGLRAEPESIRAFAAAFTDMRAMLREAQDSFAMHGQLRVPERVEAIDREPVWPTPVDGPELLTAVASVFSSYLALPPRGAEALALWSVFTHAHEAFGYSPILAAVSPVKRSGKTRLFEVLSQLVWKPVVASSITPAAVFRMGGVVDDLLGEVPPLKSLPSLTLLADEGDAWMKLRPELRGVLDSGHTRRAAFVIRVTADGPTRFSTFYPKALALIDTSATELPPTVVDRSIIIPMRRRRHDERVLTLRIDRSTPDLVELRRKAARWVDDQFYAFRESNPSMPEGIGDRTADNWRPLLAIAEVAGGDWPERASEACRVLSGTGNEDGELTVLLLRDIRETFETERTDRLPSQVLGDKLRGLDERPWRRMLTSFKLAQMLRPFQIKPKALWGSTDGDRMRTMRGYFLADFQEVFDRYIP